MMLRNELSFFVLVMLIGSWCHGKKSSVVLSKNKDQRTDAVTRALYPYLKQRGGLGFPGETPYRLKSLAWHPTEDVFAIAGGPRSSAAELSLYEVFGSADGARMESRSSVTVGDSYAINTVAWHPSGAYLTVGATDANPESLKQLRVYAYADKKLGAVPFISLQWGGEGASIQSVAWHPTGRFLAVGGSSSTLEYNVIVYAFDAATPALVGLYGIKLGPSATTQALTWDATGKYLAIGCSGEATGKAALQIYQFKSDIPYAFTQKSVVDFGGAAASVKALVWSPSGSYLAVGGYAGLKGINELALYSAPEGALTALSSAVIDFGEKAPDARINTLSWDPQEEYLLVGGYNFPPDGAQAYFTYQAAMYIFKDNVFTPKVGTRVTYSKEDDAYVSAMAWSPSRRYVLIGGHKPKNDKELWLTEFVTHKDGIKN